MVSQTIETPTEVVADPAIPDAVETETPTPTEPVGDESAAPEGEEPAAAELQVEVEQPKPDYITREEWEKERAEVAAKAASQALEEDRRRRQTEGARKAQAEERAKTRLAQTVDTVKTALVARGYDPDVATDDSVVTAIDRVAQERAQAIIGEQAALVDQAFDFLVAPAFGQTIDLDDSWAPIARQLSPKVQSLIDTIRPQIETNARKGYIAESELPAKVEAEIARRAAKGREGQEELKRPSGAPVTGNTNSIEYWEGRVAHEGEDGYPDMSASDWATYKNLRRQHGYN